MIDYDKRMKEFVWYHINGDGDCNGQVLKVLAKYMNDQDKFDLAYFYSITYCCTSALFLFEHRNEIIEDYNKFASSYKDRLVFQSDRKYVRMMNNFSIVLKTWLDLLNNHAQEFNGKFISQGVIDTKSALYCVENWYFFSRFSAYLFIETYCDILSIKAAHAYGLDYEGDNMTFAGGLFYCFGMDEEAQYVHKYHKLPTTNDFFEELIKQVQKEVIIAGGDDNFTKLETSLCAYEKFFKGTRYNGYYADRQLEETLLMNRDQEFATVCSSVMHARSVAIPREYRGELNGWNGIRKDKKKSYNKNGRIDYCPF